MTIENLKEYLINKYTKIISTANIDTSINKEGLIYKLNQMFEKVISSDIGGEKNQIDLINQIDSELLELDDINDYESYLDSMIVEIDYYAYEHTKINELEKISLSLYTKINELEKISLSLYTKINELEKISLSLYTKIIDKMSELGNLKNPDLINKLVKTIISNISGRALPIAQELICIIDYFELRS